MEKEPRQEKLDPQEQLLISGKIRRLYEVEPEDFDSETYVKDASEIVKALDSKIKPSGFYQKTTITTRNSESFSVSGATDLGDLSASIPGSRETTRNTKNREEYKIGAYVVTKLVGTSVSTMWIEHFWDRGVNNISFENFSPDTFITYDNETLDPTNIGRRFTVITKRKKPLFRSNTEHVEAVQEIKHLWIKGQ